jgi:hypothetical protein
VEVVGAGGVVGDSDQAGIQAVVCA